MLTKFFLNSKRFWLLLVPFVVQHLVIPGLAKIGLTDADGMLSGHITQWILNLLQLAGVKFALDGGLPVTTSR